MVMRSKITSKKRIEPFARHKSARMFLRGARSKRAILRRFLNSASDRKATDLKRIDSALISFVDCIGGHSSVICKYPTLRYEYGFHLSALR